MDHLGMFAKHWTPGKVKTRLAATIGEAQSAHVYHAMLSYLVDSLGSVGDCRTIAFTPIEAQSDFANLIGSTSTSPSWQLTPQVQGSLGQRMAQFFQSSFSTQAQGMPANNVVLIGSDCPTITPELCAEAFELLRTNDVVLGPTTDGGYYLVAMARQYRDVFSGITYSTQSVLDQTIKKMQSDQVKYALLQPREDIDEYSNLAALYKTMTENRLPNQMNLLSAIERAMAAERSS